MIVDRVYSKNSLCYDGPLRVFSVMTLSCCCILSKHRHHHHSRAMLSGRIEEPEKNPFQAHVLAVEGTQLCGHVASIAGTY